jgi:hypothetical protein
MRRSAGFTGLKKAIIVILRHKTRISHIASKHGPSELAYIKEKAMKNHWILLLCLLIGPAISLFGQEIKPKVKIYNAKVTLNETPFNLKGSFYALRDSSILIGESLSKEKILSRDISTQEIFYSQIQKIGVRPESQVGKGAAIGALSGFVLGFVCGAAAGDTPGAIYVKNNFFHLNHQLEYYTEPEVPWERKALKGGILGACSGALWGAVIGSIRVNIWIDGDGEMFQKERKRLEKFTIPKGE